MARTLKRFEVERLDPKPLQGMCPPAEAAWGQAAPPRWRAAVTDPSVWRRTLVLGLPVGLLQAAINQGDHWWQHQIDGAVIAKTILSPLLSCSIAFASVLTTRAAKPNISS